MRGGRKTFSQTSRVMLARTSTKPRRMVLEAGARQTGHSACHQTTRLRKSALLPPRCKLRAGGAKHKCLVGRTNTTPARAMNCPACHKPLTKKYRRSLNPIQWERLLSAYWMTAWHRELEHANRIETELNELNRKRRKVKASEY